MSSENTGTEKRFGEKIVAAWFETVINPALQALYLERERLSKKSWTWQHMPGQLESIRYVRQMILAGYMPNFEQFTKYHPQIGENINFHDEEVAQLAVACKRLESAILDSDDFREAFNRLTSEEALAELGVSSNDLFFSNDASDRLGWIAQEIINGTGEIPSYVGHSRLWNKRRDEFMRVLSNSAVSEEKLQADRAGEKLLQTVNRLIELLESARDQLSLEHDVPPVPTSSMVAA